MGTQTTSRVVLVAAIAALVALACGKRALEPGGGGGMGRIEAGVAGSSDGGASSGIGGGVGMVGAAGAGDRPPPGSSKRINGAACSAAVDCQSGSCLDGVCGNS